MDYRKRRRCSESADDINKVCVPKKQNLPDVKKSLRRSSSAPSFCTNKMESDKLQCVNTDQHGATSEISENFSMKQYAPFALPHVSEGINIPSNLPIAANKSCNENPCIINNPPIEVEDHLSNIREDIFKMALKRIEELQQSLCDDSSSESDDEIDLKDHLEEILDPDTTGTTSLLDPQTLGFLMCAQETMAYLLEHGVKKDNPIIVNLRNRLIQGIQQI